MSSVARHCVLWRLTVFCGASLCWPATDWGRHVTIPVNLLEKLECLTTCYFVHPLLHGLHL
jgi:hypothetical protein